MAAGCGLTDFFTEEPVDCAPGAVVAGPCGPCDRGIGELRCRDDGRGWILIPPCRSNPYDLDGDGYANEACSRAASGCCGEPDCNDDDPDRWPGHADLDEDGFDDAACGGDDCDDSRDDIHPGDLDGDDDGHDAARCGGDDCDDEDEHRWSTNPADGDGYADRDGDGFLSVGCCGLEPICDCNDDDPERWSGHADLDGDGFADEACGGDDCDDSSSARFPGSVDVDGDGHVAARCGGDDCNDDDPLRWGMPEDPEGWHADLDNDGHADARCGGDDCDDACDQCFPSFSRWCDEGRDHDCDGLVDELTGCRANEDRARSHECEPGAPRVLEVLPAGRAAAISLGKYLRFDAYRIDVAAADGVHRFAASLGPPEPSPLGVLGVGNTHDVFVARGHTFAATLNGLVILERPGRALELGDVAGGLLSIGTTTNVFVSGIYAYVAAVSSLYVVDVDSPWRPTVVATYDFDEPLVGSGLYVADGVLYLTRDVGYGATILDVSDPAAPTLVGDYPAGGSWEYETRYTDVFVIGEHAYFAVSGYAGARLEVADVAEPAAAARLGAVDVGSNPNGLYVAGYSAYVADRDGLYIVDVSDPEAPSDPVGPFRPEGSPEDAEARDVVVQYSTAWVAADDGLWVIDLDCQNM